MLQDAIPGGLPQPFAMANGRYYFIPNAWTSSAQAATVGTMRAALFYVPNACTITRLGTEVTSAGGAGSLLRIGLYANDTTTWRPSTLIVDAGTIDGNSVTVQEISGLTVPLSAGWYWSAAAGQVLAPTVRTVISAFNPMDAGTSIPGAAGVSVGALVTGVTGALPSTFGAATIATGSAFRIFAKVGP